MTDYLVRITEFLKARIAEDEYTASKALAEHPERWTHSKVYDGVYSVNLGSTHPDSDSYGVGEDTRLPREIAHHIVLFDPSRILYECHVKRLIIELYPDSPALLSLLALPYREHPDYQEVF